MILMESYVRKLKFCPTKFLFKENTDVFVRVTLSIVTFFELKLSITIPDDPIWPVGHVTVIVLLETTISPTLSDGKVFANAPPYAPMSFLNEPLDGSNAIPGLRGFSTSLYRMAGSPASIHGDVGDGRNDPS